MALNLEEIRLLITGSADDFQNAVSDARRALNKIPNTTTKEFKVATGQAREELDTIRTELERMDKFEADAEVKVAIAKALADVEAFKAVLDSIPDEKNVNVDLKQDILGKLLGLQTQFGRLGKNIQAAEAPARSFSQVFFQMFFLVKSLAPLIASLSILLGVSLVSAIIALSASLASAVGGLAALAAGFAAVLGPAVIGVVAIFSRFQKILEAVKAANKAQDVGAKESTAGTKEAAAAAEQRTRREEALRDAQQAVVTSERAYRDAVVQARQAIEQANQRANDAQQELADSTRALEQTTVDAYDAMRQAAEDVADAIRGIEHAKLGIEEAELATRRARLEMQKFAEQAGIAGDSFIKKITDVDIDPKALEGVLQKVGKDAGLDTEQQLQFEELALRLREATLNERDAVDQLSDSRDTLTKSRREEAKFAQQGIRAYEPYIGALERVAHAEREAGDAADNAALLRRRGVQGAPAVIAALAGVRDAQERLNTAQREMTAGSGLTAAQQAAEDAQSAFSGLSDAEQRFARQIVSLGSYLRSFFQPLTDHVFDGLADAAEGLPLILGPLRGAFGQLGKAFGDVVKAFAVELIRPETLGALRQFTEQAATVIRLLGTDIFISLFRIFIRLGQIALPPLVFLLEEFAGWLDRIDEGLRSPEGTNLVNTMIESFRVWMKLIGAVAGAIGGLIEVIAPIGDELVGWLTDAIKGFTEWLHTAEGQKKVKDFFRDTIPAVKGLLTFLAKLTKLFLVIIQVLGPVAAGFFDAINPLIDLLTWVIDLLNKIPFVLRFALGGFIAFDAAGKAIGLVGKAIGAIPNLLARIPGAAGKLVQPFENFSTKIAFFLGRVAARIREIPAAIGRMAADAVLRLANLAVDAGKMGRLFAQRLANGVGQAVGMLVRLLGPVINAGRRIVDGLVNVFRGIGERVRRLLSGVLIVVKSIINQVIDLINFTTRRINSITPGKISMPGPIPDIPGVPDIPEIPRLAAGGLVDAATLALLGEGSDKEAVLPLNRSMFKALAKQLSRFLPAPGAVSAAMPRMAFGGGTGSVRGDLNVHLPPAPAAAVPDARHQAAQLAAEMRRRGW